MGLRREPDDASNDADNLLDVREFNGFAADAPRRIAIRAGVMVTIG